MKKSLSLAAVIIVAGFLSGCATAPKHYNMTGNWKYTFEETGKSDVQNGTMTLSQDAFTLRGMSNDATGEFQLRGTISENSPTFTIEGKRNDYKRTFHLTGKLSSDNRFEGTFTTDQNTSGTMEGVKTTSSE